MSSLTMLACFPGSAEMSWKLDRMLPHIWSVKSGISPRTNPLVFTGGRIRMVMFPWKRENKETYCGMAHKYPNVFDLNRVSSR